MMQTLVDKTEQRWQIFLTFAANLYLFFLCSTKWNAGVSISAGLVGVAILFFYGYKRRKIQWPQKLFLLPYLLFMGSVLLAAYLTGDPPSIKETQRFVSISLSFWLVYLALQQGKSFEKNFQWGMLAGAIVLNIYACVDLLTSSPGARINGVTASPNNFAMIWEVLLPFLWLKAWQMRDKIHHKTQLYYFCLYFIVSALSTFFLFFTKSRGGITGFILGAICIVFYFFMQGKGRKPSPKYIAVLLLLLMAAGGASYSNISYYDRRPYDQERILLLRSAYAIWQDHKVYGVGFKAWNRVYREKYILPEAKEPNLMLPHNNTADFFSCTGILGGVGYLIFTFATLFFLLKRVSQYPDNIYLKAMFWCWIALFIHGMVDNTAYAKYSGRIFYAMWAVTLLSCPERGRNG